MYNYHDYWLHSLSIEANNVRVLIGDQMDAGAARNYPDDESYRNCPVVCKRAVETLGYKWEQKL